MKRLALAVLGTLIGIPQALTAEDMSVLVQTIPVLEGSIPDIVTAYGTAGPALDSSMTISLQSQGRVSRFLVTPGESITAGQPLLDFAVSQSALGSFQQAQTALETAKIERTRIQQLLAQQLATKDQLTQADKAIADAQTTLDTLTRSGADKPNLTIKAPFDGVVATIPVAQGDTVAQGAPMMTLMRADGLVVSVGIEPSQRFRVKRGNEVRLEPLTSGGTAARGTLARIDGLLNAKTHLIDADVATTAALLPGAAFRALITVGQFKGVVVPRDAILTDAGGSYLFQAVGTKAHRVGVRLVGGDDRQSAVTGQFDRAMPVVVQGNYQLTEGMTLRIDPSHAPTATDAASR